MNRTFLATLLLATPLLAPACRREPPAPGYDGPLASAEAREVLQALAGREFEDREGVFGGGHWTVHAFCVGPYPGAAEGLGPYVDLAQGERRVYLPMEADGDAADLHRRVVGAPHPRLTATATSAAYRQALARAQR